MKPTHSNSSPVRELAAYLEGELGAADVASVEHYLAASREGRQRLEQLRSIRDALSRAEDEFAELDLLPSIRARIREQAAARPTATQSSIVDLLRRPAAALLTATLAAAGICLGFGFAFRQRAPAAETFRAKSASQATNAARWAGVQAYRVHAGKSEALSETLAPGDGLLFSYTNLGRAPLTNLMIFALDSNAEVHWFHPAYEREGSNPSSIAIQSGAAQVPLAELIQDDFPPGELTIHALFSTRALRVLEVEAWLKKNPRCNLLEKVPNGVDHVLTTRVVP